MGSNLTWAVKSTKLQQAQKLIAGNGSWCEWTAWSECSATCAEQSSLQVRQRTCTCPEPRFGGNDCEGKRAPSCCRFVFVFVHKSSARCSGLEPHSRAPKKNTSHENEVLPQDITTSHTNTMLPTRKSVPRSSRQLDYMKIS